MSSVSWTRSLSSSSIRAANAKVAGLSILMKDSAFMRARSITAKLNSSTGLQLESKVVEEQVKGLKYARFRGSAGNDDSLHPRDWQQQELSVGSAAP